MTLPELSIKRHVLAWMLSAVLLLFGVISSNRVGVDRLPRLDFPVISVSTVLKGGDPEIIDSSVTNVIETAITSVPGIEHISSVSQSSISRVNIIFALDKNIDIAFTEVQAKINQAVSRLPKDADPPVIYKVEANAQPIIWLALQGDRTAQQINQYAANVIKKKLESVQGVGAIWMGGQQERKIRVNLLPERMAAHNVAPRDILDTFAREHIQTAGGFIVGENTEHQVKLDLEFHRIEDLAGMIVGYRSGAPVHLRDVAEIEDGIDDHRYLARLNGTPTVGIGVVKIANTNTVATARRVIEKVEKELRPQLPPGMQLQVVGDDSIHIVSIIDSLKEHLIEGTLLAALVVWFFLRSWRSTVIISLAIPVSLMGSIAAIYFAGLTLNTMTMLALLLLIGVVVDDAIVVLENIFRHREEIDPDPLNAAIHGANEVAFAVMAATLSLVCIFAAVVFIPGVFGQMFGSFAIVVTVGVLVSLFVSLTLTPMLCSRYLDVDKQHGALYHRLDRILQGMDHLYHRLLDWTLTHRWKVILATTAVVASSVFFFSAVGKTFVPDDDEGRFLVMVRTPLGSSIDYTDRKLAEVEATLRKQKELVSQFAMIGTMSPQVNQAVVVVRMLPRHQRKISQQQAIATATRALSTLAGVQAFPAPYPIIGGARGEPMQFVLSGPSLDEVARLSNEIKNRLQQDPDIISVDNDLQLDLPQVVLQADRQRIAAAGLSSAEVALAINLISGGIDIAKYNDQPGDGQRYDIRVKAKEGSITRPEDLSKIFLRGQDGRMVRMDSVASFDEKLGPASINRYDLAYAANFFVTPRSDLGKATTRLNQIAKTLLPPGYSVKMIGAAEEMGKTMGQTGFLMLLALLLLYMVLASQFNSFLQPAIVMLAQPLAVVGGLAALWATGQTLNIISIVGLVLLIGLVAKNSILLVDLTNQRRSQGMKVEQALRDACPTRMRPVVMTSATVILALLPAALGLGAGAELNQPLAVTVIGGMISSTLLTLVLVPAVYSLIEGWRERRHGK
ncbi:efflux RND transporter permease subunit [Denitratisoma oestradiolicum]|uniref:AcrB/AcrD/AcrF family protein n=1 Tax=Denitratisoma oestradiolicum TaxID=311182 RepID=A0A6S6XY35_9PROT|nr:efflux RND transporter permease subunit [Denitratisoma oestradiolicum]TWO80031.1 acriflavin resistance protein [Denitratisoma oestradiolicum]CAB1369801.1 AcrB/AcrD/AcrF family protein [Denitratisoma oestradiolicum]